VDESGVFQRFVKVDDHVAEVAEEDWSVYWAEHKSDTSDFQEFLRNPKPVLQERLGIADDYRIETTIVNHEIGMAISSVCSLISVFPRERLIYLLLYKH